MLHSFTEPPLHWQDKASVGFRLKEYFSDIERKNVVLLGDSTSDCDCLANVPGIEEALLVGFFNKDRGVERSRYEEAFDILLTNEGLPATEDLDLLPVLELLEALLAPPSPSPDEDGALALSFLGDLEAESCGIPIAVTD